MSIEDNPEKSREESPEWHRVRAERLRKSGFTKMAEEHEQLAQAIEQANRGKPARHGEAHSPAGERHGGRASRGRG
jgi:hypothetical protein